MTRGGFAFVPPLALCSLGGFLLGGVVLPGCDSAVDLGGTDAPAAIDAGTDAAEASAPPSCIDVCRRLRGCGLLDDAARSTTSCVEGCAARATPADLACAMREPCETVLDACDRARSSDAGARDDGGGAAAFDVSVCQSGCQRAHAFDCLSAAELTECRGLCETSARRATYAECVRIPPWECEEQIDCLQELRRP